MMACRHTDRLNYVVAGTLDRLEDDLVLFVKLDAATHLDSYGRRPCLVWGLA